MNVMNQLILGDNLEIMLNKEDLTSWKFKPGQHTIAVKTVDNEGLEAIEVLKIKVNGVVKREE
jgi:hypothetical protein